MVVAWKQRSRPSRTGLNARPIDPPRPRAGDAFLGVRPKAEAGALEDHFEAAARSFGSCSCIRNLIHRSKASISSFTTTST